MAGRIQDGCAGERIGKVAMVGNLWPDWRAPKRCSV